MKRVLLSVLLLCLFSPVAISHTNSGSSAEANRQVWLNYMNKVARPVIYNLAHDQLKEKMPDIVSKRSDNPKQRHQNAYLEAFARTLSGIAPWLNGEGGSRKEIALRNQYRKWALEAIANAVNPKAKDYLLWKGGQALVDASFFSLALIRAPWLWNHLNAHVKNQVVTALKLTRSTVPVYTNWLLFSGMIEAFFCKYGLPYDPVRIDYGVREFSEHWYTGDGMFSDGMQFDFNYYNSYVIQPYLITIVHIVDAKTGRYKWFEPKLEAINKRYAVIQERMINDDGTFPVIGRSIVYRGGAFQLLADMALRNDLPASLKPGEVRAALTAVIKKTLDAPSTFTHSGWLNIGLCGNQPNLAEFYITRGSLYLCSEIFLPLGLPASNPFWTDPPAPWTAVKVWSGSKDVKPDHALEFHYIH